MNCRKCERDTIKVRNILHRNDTAHSMAECENCYHRYHIPYDPSYGHPEKREAADLINNKQMDLFSGERNDQ